MKIANAVHQAHPWLITGRRPQLRLLDAWDLPVHGGREDFADFVALVSSFDPAQAESMPARALFALRFRIGRWLHWDEQVPPEGALPHGFVPMYQSDDEFAAEIRNATVHGALQLAWVEQADGTYRGRLGVYVEPRGLFGAAYLRLIEPFRRLVVYPALTAEIGRRWAARRSVRVS